MFAAENINRFSPLIYVDIEICLHEAYWIAITTIFSYYPLCSNCTYANVNLVHYAKNITFFTCLQAFLKLLKTLTKCYSTNP